MALAPSITPNGRRRAPLSAVPVQATGQGRRLWDGYAAATSNALMRELYKNIPMMKEGINILSGFAGVPCITGEDDDHTAEINAFLNTVPVGWNGAGLATWQRDHMGQALWYGHGVMECEIAPQRNNIARLWSYESQAFRLEVDDTPAFRVRQINAQGAPVLNPETSKVSTFDSQGGDPHGQPLFLACPTVAQAYVTALHARKSTWLRCGIPVFHVNVEPDPEWQDRDTEEIGADGRPVKESTALLSAIGAQVRRGIKSQVERGVAEDIYSLGKVTITVVGLDGKEMSFQTDKRDFIEELVVASGVPPFLYGYSWATTETMSRVMMDRLIGKVNTGRSATEPAIRFVLELWHRLRADRREWSLEWEDSILMDLVETSHAAQMDAQAEKTKRQNAVTDWRLGIIDQEGYAERITGKSEVKQKMTEPPDSLPELAGGGGAASQSHGAGAGAPAPGQAGAG